MGSGKGEWATLKSVHFITVPYAFHKAIYTLAKRLLGVSNSTYIQSHILQTSGSECKLHSKPPILVSPLCNLIALSQVTKDSDMFPKSLFAVNSATSTL